MRACQQVQGKEKMVDGWLRYICSGSTVLPVSLWVLLNNICQPHQVLPMSHNLYPNANARPVTSVRPCAYSSSKVIGSRQPRPTRSMQKGDNWLMGVSFVCCCRSQPTTMASLATEPLRKLQDAIDARRQMVKPLVT